MTWQARIEHTPAGLALTFGAPLSRLDMAPDVAQHLASLLAVEARHRLAGVVRTLEAEPTPLVVDLTERHAHFCDCLDCMGGSTNA